MKDITEKEAMAALKKAMPWAKESGIYIDKLSWNGQWNVTVEYSTKATSLFIDAMGCTLRAAVNEAIKEAKRIGAAK